MQQERGQPSVLGENQSGQAAEKLLFWHQGSYEQFLPTTSDKEAEIMLMLQRQPFFYNAMSFLDCGVVSDSKDP